MSIYPVRLNEWFPVGDENYCKDIVDAMRCFACGKKCRYKKVWGHHSLPWGYGDVWCSEKCLNSGKEAKPDKRRERRIKRKMTKLFGADYWKNLNLLTKDE